MNMGHRIVFVHHMMHGRSAWPAWRDPISLLRHGMITFLGMVLYYTPGVCLAALGELTGLRSLHAPATILLIAATIAIPGYMSHDCVAFRASEIFNPARALRRCIDGGRGYWHAWAIALAALGLSFLGLLAFGIGFLITSVWFWQVAGFSFASVFSQRFVLRGA